MDEASAVASPDILRRTTAQYMCGDDDGNFELFCLFFHGLALHVAIRFVNIKVAGCKRYAADGVIVTAETTQRPWHLLDRS